MFQLHPAAISKSLSKQPVSVAQIYTITPTAGMATSSSASQCVLVTNPPAQSQPSDQM